MAAHDSSTRPRPVPRSVLIIRPTALGDVSRTVPVLAALRHALPDARIDWLVQDAFADAIRHHPALTSVVPFPRKRFAQIGRSPRAMSEFFAWARQLRKQRYDLVIDLQGLLRSGIFSWITRAPRRIGYANAREMGWIGYNRRHKIDPLLHTVDHMLALIAAEGFDVPTPKPDMRLYVGADDDAWLDRYLDEHNLRDKPYFVIAPTARWRSKCWPIERYAEITHRLLESGAAGGTAVVLAAPNETTQVQPLIDALKATGHSLLSPATTVGQMMAVLRRASLLVCNDSAPLHIAVGFDRPIVAIFGPTNPAMVGPYRRDECVVRPAHVPPELARDRDDQSLISQVGVEEVWNKVLEQLNRKT